MEEFDERSYNLTLSKVGTVSLRICVFRYWVFLVCLLGFFFFLFTVEVINIYPHNIGGF